MSQYRHELKIRINPFDKEILVRRLSKVLKKDSHTGKEGFYKVRSLYFDDLNDRVLKEKLMGVKYREKFRIRIYDGCCSFIRLEKKVKNDNLGYKESALLTLDECQSLLFGDYHFLINRSEEVCKQLYLKLRTGLFKPKTVIEYERQAYVWEPGRIRITIDSNVKTGMLSTDFFNFDLLLADVGDQQTAILEVKYGPYLPAHINNLIQLNSRQRDSISKYVLSRSFG